MGCVPYAQVVITLNGKFLPHVEQLVKDNVAMTNK
jgi:hypothetical protein